MFLQATVYWTDFLGLFSSLELTKFRIIDCCPSQPTRCVYHMLQKCWLLTHLASYRISAEHKPNNEVWMNNVLYLCLTSVTGLAAGLMSSKHGNVIQCWSWLIRFNKFYLSAYGCPAFLAAELWYHLQANYLLKLSSVSTLPLPPRKKVEGRPIVCYQYWTTHYIVILEVKGIPGRYDTPFCCYTSCTQCFRHLMYCLNTLESNGWL